MWAVALLERGIEPSRPRPSHVPSIRHASGSTTRCSRDTVELVAARAGPGVDVRVRPDRLRRRRTSATAAPRSSFDIIRRYLEWTGLDVTFVSNVTDVEDKIIARAATRGHDRARASRREYEAVLLRPACDRLGVRDADHVPARHRVHRPHARARSASSSTRGHAYVVEGQGVYFDVEIVPGLRRAAAPHARGAARVGRRAGRGRRGEAQPDGLRALEGGEAGRARVGLAVGPGPAGLAHRVLGDVARPARRGLRPPRRRRRPRVPAPRERAGAGRGRRPRVRPPLDPHAAWCTIGGEKMSKSLGNFTTLADALDRRTARARSGSPCSRRTTAAPIELGADRARPPRRRRSTGSTRSFRRADAAGVDVAARRSTPRRSTGSAPRWTTTSTPPHALAAIFDAVARRQPRHRRRRRRPRAASLVADGARAARRARPRRSTRRPATTTTPRSTRWCASATTRARRTRLRRGRPHPRRAHRARHQARGHARRHHLAPMSGRGGSRDARRASGRARKRERRDLGQQVEGRQRGARAAASPDGAGCTSVWLVERRDGDAPALAEIAALAEAPGCGSGTSPADQLERRARTDAPQGVVAFAAPVADRRPRRPARRPARVPRRARRRHRSAEPRRGPAHRRDRRRDRRGAAAPPRRRAHARPSRRRRPARSSTCRSPFVSGIPGALDRAERAGVWSVGLDADGDQSRLRARGRRRSRSCSCSAPRVAGSSRLARDALRRGRVDPDARSHRVAQRERGRRGRVHRDRASTRGIAFRARRVSSVGRALLL